MYRSACPSQDLYTYQKTRLCIVKSFSGSALTVDFESLARLGTNPLAINVALLNEERLVFQLVSAGQSAVEFKIL